MILRDPRFALRAFQITMGDPDVARRETLQSFVVDSPKSCRQQLDAPGGRAQMAITEDLHIDCAPATAFDLMADVRNETRWNDGVSRAELSTDEPVGQGSQFVTYHGSPLGRIESTITAFDRPKRLEFAATSKRMNLAISFTFTEAGSGTLAHGTFDPKPKGVMAVLFPLLRPMIRRDMAKQHQHFKVLCESQAQSPSA